MSFILYLIRHCRPADQEPGYSGEPNPPLGATGIRQAAHVADRAASWGIDALYASSMRRALQTAEPIHARLGVEWHVWPSLSETSRRDWPALRRSSGDAADSQSEVSERDQDAYPPVANTHPHTLLSQPFDPVDRWVYRSETREQSYARGRQVIDAMISRYRGTDRKVAIVCHAAFGSVLLTLLGGSPPCDYNRFGFAHGAVARVDLSDGPEGGPMEAAIRYTNDVRHFPPELVTEGCD